MAVKILELWLFEFRTTESVEVMVAEVVVTVCTNLLTSFDDTSGLVTVAMQVSSGSVYS